jgi:hypothetical protein
MVESWCCPLTFENTSAQQNRHKRLFTLFFLAKIRVSGAVVVSFYLSRVTSPDFVTCLPSGCLTLIL